MVSIANFYVKDYTNTETKIRQKNKNMQCVNSSCIPSFFCKG